MNNSVIYFAPDQFFMKDLVSKYIFYQAGASATVGVLQTCELKFAQKVQTWGRIVDRKNAPYLSLAMVPNHF